MEGVSVGKWLLDFMRRNREYVENERVREMEPKGGRGETSKSVLERSRVRYLTQSLQQSDGVSLLLWVSSCSAHDLSSNQLH